MLDKQNTHSRPLFKVDAMMKPIIPHHKCIICEKTFNLKNKLKRHLKEIHLNEFNFSKCSICPKSFKRKEHLKRHILAIHLKDKFSCSICNQRYVELNRIKQHFTKKHKLTVCQYCNNFYTLEHSETHHKNCEKENKESHSENVHYCSKCKLCFTTKEKLKRHLNSQNNKCENIKVHLIKKQNKNSQVQNLIKLGILHIPIAMNKK